MSNFSYFKNTLQRICIVGMLACGISFCSVAQDLRPYLPAGNPSIPSTASILKTVNIPIGKYNGTPNISIPIYTINLKGYQYPISLSYNASGIKVDEESGNVGLGWNINLVGQIIHEVRNNDDLSYSSSNYLLPGTPEFVDKIPYPTYQMYYKIKHFKICSKPSEDISFTSPDIGLYRPFVYRLRSCLDEETNYSDYMSHQETQNGYPEHEPDLFYLNVPGGYASTFMLRRDGSVLEKKNTDSRFSYTSKEDGPRNYSFWNVTDRDGVKYIFDKEEAIINFPAQSAPTGYRTGWSLSEIETLNNEKIKFSYTKRSAGTAIVNFTGINEIEEITPPPTTNPGLILLNQGVKTLDQQQLNGITFPGGKIDVFYGNRLDIDFDQRIDSIKVYALENGIYKLLNKFNFQYNYFQANFNGNAIYTDNVSDDFHKKRLKLASVTNNELKHSFIYNETLLPDKAAYARDHWGYFNGKNNNSFIANEDYRVLQHGANVDRSIAGANREPDSLYNQCFILKKIIYPTGGSSEFEYETNDYDIRESEKFDFSNSFAKKGEDDIVKTRVGPGLRVKRVSLKTDDSDIKPLKTSYIYNYYELLTNPATQQKVMVKRSYGILPSRPSYSAFKYQPTEQSSFLSRRYASTVTDINSSNRGLGYSKVVELNEGSDGRTLKTEAFFYNQPDIVYDYSMWRIPGLKNGYNSFNGLPLKTIKYKSLEDNKFEKLSIQETNYHFIRRHEAWGLRYLSGGSNVGNIEWGEVANFFYPVLFNDDYNVTKTIDSLYDSKTNRFIVKTVNHFYSPESYTFLDSTVTKNSKGELQKTEFKYPKSFVQNPLYGLMVQNNMVSPVIQESRFAKGNLVEQTKNEYANFSGKIYPESKWHSFGNSSLEKEISFDAYDTVGNVIQASVKSKPSSYRWGNNSQNMIALATSAVKDEVYAYDFEENNEFSKIRVEQSNLKAHTGKYSGLIRNPGSSQVYGEGSLLFIKNPGVVKSFTYSGWIYSESPTAELSLVMFNAVDADVDKITFTEKGKWVYVSKTFSVPASMLGVRIRISNNGGGNVWFDDLRIYPSDAQMSTYTYAPLVGMTSQIDEKGKTTYYEYDEFHRLKYVRDSDGNILQSNEYHYK